MISLQDLIHDCINDGIEIRIRFENGQTIDIDLIKLDGKVLRKSIPFLFFKKQENCDSFLEFEYRNSKKTLLKWQENER